MGVLYRSFTKIASNFPEQNHFAAMRSSAFGGHFPRCLRLFHAICLHFNPVFTAFYQGKALIQPRRRPVLRTDVRNMRIVNFLCIGRTNAVCSKNTAVFPQKTGRAWALPVFFTSIPGRLRCAAAPDRSGGCRRRQRGRRWLPRRCTPAPPCGQRHWPWMRR